MYGVRQQPFRGWPEEAKVPALTKPCVVGHEAMLNPKDPINSLGSAPLLYSVLTLARDD